MATPFLLLMFEAREAIQINLVLSLIISCALILKIKKDVDIDILKRFITGSLLGLHIGISVFLMMDMTWLKLGVSILILVLTVLLILHFRIKQTTRRDFSIGGLSGPFTTSIGMPGPPLPLYFSGTNTTKEKLRGTTRAFYVCICSSSLVIQGTFAGADNVIWVASLEALPLVSVGSFVGQVMFKW